MATPASTPLPLSSAQSVRRIAAPSTPAASLTVLTPRTPQVYSTPHALHQFVPFTSPAAQSLNTASSPGRLLRPSQAQGRTRALRIATPLTSGRVDSPAASSTVDGFTGMKTTLSGLGLGVLGLAPSIGVRVSEPGPRTLTTEERQGRLVAVLTTLGSRPGLAGRDGFERLSRRFGMEVLWEEETAAGRGILSLAGGTMVIDVELQPQAPSIVTRVALSFPGLADSVSAHQSEASALLQRDLSPVYAHEHGRGSHSPLVTLNAFADNLERLTQMDGLSTPGANCFEAVAGIYTALRRLYEHEKTLVDKFVMQLGSSDVDSETVSICSRSGIPRMHAGGRVGLALQYWKKKRYLHSREPQASGKDHPMSNIDEARDAQNPYHDGSKISSIIIECERSLPALYPSIRISDDWLRLRDTTTAQTGDNETAEIVSGSVQDTRQDTNASLEHVAIDWLEPPPLLVPPVVQLGGETSAAAATDLVPPSVRFLAKLEPPAILPLQVAVQLFASVGVDISGELLTTETTFEAHIVGGAQYVDHASDQQYRTTCIITDSIGEAKTYNITMHMPSGGRPLARIVSSFPFTHPRQLLALLPTLRQYAAATSLLASVLPSGDNEDRESDTFDSAEEQQDLEASFASLLDGDAGATSKPRRALDITFYSLPIPRFAIVMPSKVGVARVQLNVGPDGVLEIVAHDGLLHKGGNAETTARRLASLTKALTVSEDLCVWAEWARGQCLGSDHDG